MQEIFNLLKTNKKFFQLRALFKKTISILIRGAFHWRGKNYYLVSIMLLKNNKFDEKNIGDDKEKMVCSENFL